MKSNQLMKSWAIALVLPVFSIVVAAAAVSMQDRDQLSYGVDQTLETMVNPALQRPGMSELQDADVNQQNVNWKRIRTQDQGSGLIQDQGSGLVPENVFGGQDVQDPFPGAEDAADILDGPDFRAPAVPRPTANKRFSSWNSASPNSENRIDDELRASWVSLDENGSLNGSVDSFVETDAIQVFLLRGGNLTASTQTDANGRFSIDGLSPGTYSLIGFNETAFFAEGFVALQYNASDVNTPNSINVMAAPRESFLITDLVERYAPQTKFRIFNIYEFEEGEETAKHYGTEALASNDVPHFPSHSIQNTPVSLFNGKMIGRVHQIDKSTGRPINASSTTVHLLQNNQIVATTQVDNYGIFEIDGLSPGVYGVVAGGHDGLGVVGIELIDTDSPSIPTPSVEDMDVRSSQSNIGLVSYETRAQSSEGVFDMTLCLPETTGWLNHYITEQSYNEAVNSPLPELNNMTFQPNFDPASLYGNQPGLLQDLFGDLGFGNGGFGGGFGGGFTDLLLPAVIGGVLIETIDDDDDFNGGVVPPPASPSSF